MFDFHIDDSWDVLTAGGSFLDHDPQGPTLYGADIMVHPTHQHHGLAHALTDQTRFLVQEENLWRMVRASRLPGFAKHSATMSAEQYVAAVLAGTLARSGAQRAPERRLVRGETDPRLLAT